jgi:hypothetical protein
VTAGDVIETRIAYAPASGAMTASIGVRGGTAEQQSSILSVRPGLGRIVALPHRSSTSHQICEHIRCLSF